MRAAVIALPIIVAWLITGCTKANRKCIDRDKVTGKMDEAAALLRDGAKAALEHSASASMQLNSAASLFDSIADEVAVMSGAAGDMRAAAARLRAAADNVQNPGGDDAAVTQINEAAKHFKAAAAPLTSDSATYCSEPRQ